MDECLKFAKENKAKEIFLISNDSLRIARNLYDKYGFKEAKLDSQKYLRGNIKMSLKITINYLLVWCILNYVWYSSI